MTSEKILSNYSSNGNASQHFFSLFNNSTAPLLTTLSLVCFLVNITIISLFFIDPLHSLRRPSGYLVASLNVGAILTSTSSILITLPGIDSTIVLSVNVFFAVTSVAATASFSFIFILSYERYVLVTAPIKYKRVVTVRLVQILAASIWIWSGIIGVFMLKMFATTDHQWLSLPFGILFIILVTIDIKTFIEIKKLNSNITSITETGPERSAVSQAIKKRNNMHSRFALVVVLLLLNFIFLACPMFVYDALSTFNKKCEFCLFTSNIADATMYAATMILFICHDINTALFYLILIPKYRLSFVAMFRKCKMSFLKKL
ncbi:adenosine receptor A2a-like [Paramuricea clavata]|uniref:Adenosine receptor A2a-like n=1 Tax=Paramuricea clavata TaxID=317549 RepID=A0A6S7KEW9_PARCT|nr:adenosine receptor A2a-like [Paramuricea clavata]